MDYTTVTSSTRMRHIFNSIKRARFIISTVILLIGIVFTYGNIFELEASTASSKYIFPDAVKQWESKDVIYDPTIIDILKPDQVVYKTYGRNNRNPVTLFVAYYNTFDKADNSHSPLVCMTGQGWEITEQHKEIISIDHPLKESIEVNKLYQQKSDVNTITLFWYQSKEQVYTNRGLQKISLFLNRIMGKNDKNAFVRVNITFNQIDRIGEVEAELAAFVNEIYAVIVGMM